MTKMNKWEEKRLEDIIIVNPNVKLKKGNIYPFIDIDKVSPHKKFVTNVETKTYDGQSSSKFCSGDTVFSRITPCLENRKIAETKFIGDAAFGSTEFYVFRSKKDLIYKKFVYYLVSSDIVVLPAINSMTGASGRQRADKRFIQRLKVMIPELPIQKRIADILSNYDDLIENNNRRIAILEKAAQDLYKEWFVRFRFPGHEHVKFENGLPQGWEVKKLGDIAQFKRGTNITKKEVIQGTIPVIAGGLEPSCFHNRANTKKPVITISASGANAGFVKFNYTDVWASDCSFVDSAIKNIYFVYETLNSIRTIILNLQVGSAQPHVYAKEINKLSIIYPSTAVAEHTEQKLKLFHNKISLLVQQNQNLKKQRDLLLPRLMSGKLEV